MEDIHFPSRMLTAAGGLLTVSGVLTALAGQALIGGMLWAAASCLFFAARNFRLAENQKQKAEAYHDEQETV